MEKLQIWYQEARVTFQKKLHIRLIYWFAVSVSLSALFIAIKTFR